jgi:hypothetical protein
MATRARLALVLALTAVVACSQPVPPAEAATHCGPSAGVTLCLIVPDGPLTREARIEATVSGSVARVEFTLDGEYLNYEYVGPFEFVWPTQRYANGPAQLTARVRRGGTLGNAVSVQVTLSNSPALVKNPNDWNEVFQPRAFTGDPLVAAVGNAGGDMPAETKLRDSILAQDPHLFLYLGEVHEFGSWATRRDHYGLASFDAPGGVGTKWGRMARYTAPTQGNHESGSVYTPIYRDYWHQRPHWSTFVFNGVRFYNLNSECSTIGGCGTTSEQYKWLRDRLALDDERCVVGFWQKPVVSEDSFRHGPKMEPIWALLANNGGDLVVNGHTREMEESAPLNANLQRGQPNSHMVELISGAGAVRWPKQFQEDARIVWARFRVPGAVYLTLDANNPSGPEIQWVFRDSAIGSPPLRSGSVAC